MLDHRKGTLQILRDIRCEGRTSSREVDAAPIRKRHVCSYATGGTTVKIKGKRARSSDRIELLTQIQREKA